MVGFVFFYLTTNFLFEIKYFIHLYGQSSRLKSFRIDQNILESFLMTMPGPILTAHKLILVIKQISFIVPIHSTFTSALKYFIIIPSFLNERVKQKGNNKMYTFMCIFFFLFVYIWRGNNKNNLERARK